LAFEQIVFDHGDLMHVSCFRIVSSQETVRDTCRLVYHSRLLIEEARETIRLQRLHHRFD